MVRVRAFVFFFFSFILFFFFSGSESIGPNQVGCIAHSYRLPQGRSSLKTPKKTRENVQHFALTMSTAVAAAAAAVTEGVSCIRACKNEQGCLVFLLQFPP